MDAKKALLSAARDLIHKLVNCNGEHLVLAESMHRLALLLEMEERRYLALVGDQTANTRYNHNIGKLLVLLQAKLKMSSPLRLFFCCYLCFKKLLWS